MPAFEKAKWSHCCADFGKRWESQLLKSAVPFDVIGADFSHHGEDCTFETLLKSFRPQDVALSVIAEIIHDVDLKDRKFGGPEAACIDSISRSSSMLCTTST